MTTQFAPIWDDAAVAFTTIKANATDAASAAATTLLDLQVNNVSKFVVDKFGELIITPTARTSGSGSLIDLIAPADTTRAASTEATDINFNLARPVQFAAGNITNQRAIRIQAPTYSFDSASTITNASTLSISGSPVAGTNATITNRRALHIESGNSLFDGEVRVSSVLRFGTYSAFQESGNGFFITYQNQLRAYYSHPTIALSNGFSPGYVWASNVSNPATYYGLYSGTNNVIQFRGGTGSQVIQFFNTFTDSSNYERLAFQFGTYSSVRHTQIAAESAGTGTANINLVLTPRGTGAFILGPPPDGTTTGGNARGANAVDLQTSRTAASHVASGSWSAILGGRSNTASQLQAVVIGGNGNTASSQSSVVVGGDANTASGALAVVLGGYSNSATNNNAVAMGELCVSARASQFAISSDRHSVNGDCIAFSITGKGQSTTNTPIELDFGIGPSGTRQYLTIGADREISGTLMIQGVRNGGADCARFCRHITLKRVGATTTLVDAQVVGTDLTSGTSISLTADDVNDRLNVSVTGVLSQTWRWNMRFDGIEQAIGAA